ncbi:MAG: HD domain-containing protein [Bdellovibrionota bacterium]
MEIRDPIHGSIELSDAESLVLDSRVYQRLRQIKQLGFAEFSFPGATHNRFLHSIGAAHIAGLAFESIFKESKSKDEPKTHSFSNPQARARLKQALRLAALLHDVGHGPLSHTTEEVMPELKTLKLEAYKKRRKDVKYPASLDDPNRQANHEDYTIKFITDSSLTKVLQDSFSDIKPIHIACLVDKTLECPDDFFMDKGVDFRSILSQLVSSEMDCDRLDYLERDAYFCGTNYGKVELNWILQNLTYHQIDKEMYLALNRRALYAFDDFLISRHHMNLMVYFHHKSIIYEEMLNRYFISKDCTFFLPGDIEEYTQCSDYALYEHLAKQKNEWAQRITNRHAFKMLFELHSTADSKRPLAMQKELEGEGIPVIFASSAVRLSKYHGGSSVEKNFPIYVVDHYDKQSEPYPIEKSTKIFQKYDEIRRIDRLYVPPELHKKAEKIMISRKL